MKRYGPRAKIFVVNGTIAALGLWFTYGRSKQPSAMLRIPRFVFTSKICWISMSSLCISSSSPRIVLVSFDIKCYLCFLFWSVKKCRLTGY